MIKEPYQTTLLRGHPVTKLTDQLETNYIEGTLTPVIDSQAEKVYERGADEHPVLEILPGVEGIEAMVAPKLIETRQGIKVVLDARASKRARRDGPPIVALPSDYRFQLLDARLTYLWAVGGPGAFSQLGQLPVKVYARWVSEGLARAFGLDALAAITLQVVAGYYFMGQFIGETIDEGRKYGLASILARTFGLQIDLVSNIILPLGYLADVTALVEAMRTSTQNARLENLSAGILYTRLAGSWYGANARTIAAVAVEYPPTFLAMLYSAYADRTYHSSYFAKTALAADKRGQGREVVLAVDHLTHGV